MAGETLSSNAVSGIMKYVANTALPPLVGTLVMAQRVNRGYDAMPGDTVTVPLTPALTANNLAEGGTVQKQTATLGSAQITVTTHAEATIAIPDAVQVLNNIDLMKTYTAAGFVALAEKIEGDLFGLYPQLTSNASVGTGNTPLTEAVIDSAETALFKAKVPLGQPKYLVLSSDAYGPVRQISRFTENQTIASGEAIVTGEMGRIKDFTVLRSQYVKKVSTTTYNLAFTTDWAALAMKRLPGSAPGLGVVVEYYEFGGYSFRLVFSYNADTLTPQLTIDCMYGCGVVRNPFGQVVLS